MGHGTADMSRLLLYNMEGALESMALIKLLLICVRYLRTSCSLSALPLLEDSSLNLRVHIHLDPIDIDNHFLLSVDLAFPLLPPSTSTP